MPLNSSAVASAHAAGDGGLCAVARRRGPPHRAPRRGRPGSSGLGGGAAVAAATGLVLGSGAWVGAADGAAGATVAAGADCSASAGAWGERTVVRTSVATSITTAPTATGASRRIPAAAARAASWLTTAADPRECLRCPSVPTGGTSCSADRRAISATVVSEGDSRRSSAAAWVRRMGRDSKQDDGGRSSNLRGVVARARPQVGPARQSPRIRSEGTYAFRSNVLLSAR